MASQFTPDLVEAAAIALLKAQATGVSVGSIGELDIDDDDQLICDPPMARTFYMGTGAVETHDSSALTYNVDHIVQVWCAAEDLRSKQAGREASKQIVAMVLEIMTGARLLLGDGSKSEPVRWEGITGVPDDTLGRVYVVSFAVPGIAQLPGANG